MYDTRWTNVPQPDGSHIRALFDSLLVDLEPALMPFEPNAQTAYQRGCPHQLIQSHLWLGLLLCTFHGMSSYAQLWRLLVTGCVGRFAGVWLSAQVIVWQLECGGLQPLYALNTRLKDVLQQRLLLPSACSLAPSK